jgi:hypothetical protein
MASNYYGGSVEPTKMADYGYGTDHLDSRDPYSFGSYSTQPQQPQQPQQQQQQQQPYGGGFDTTSGGQAPTEQKKKGLAGQ